MIRFRTEPDVKDIRKFASQFDPKEWSKLCRSRAFTDALFDDLRKAAHEACNILDRPVYYAEPSTRILVGKKAFLP